MGFSKVPSHGTGNDHSNDNVAGAGLEETSCGASISLQGIPRRRPSSSLGPLHDSESSKEVELPNVSSHRTESESSLSSVPQSDQQLYEGQPQQGHRPMRRERGSGLVGTRRRYLLGERDIVHNDNEENDCEREAASESRSTIDHREEDMGTVNVLQETPSFAQRVSKTILDCLCPMYPICKALCRCDFDLFWRIVPSIFVLKAFWSSLLTLFFCSLFKVERTFVVEQYDEGGFYGVHKTTQAYFFGLWTYSEPIEMEYDSLGDMLSTEFELVAECKFNMKDTPEEGGPDNIFLVNGPAFIMARTCAISSVVLGFVSMVFLWLTAANSKWSCGRGRPSRWILFASLLTCAILLNFVFLVMASSVCRDGDIHESRHCVLEEGSGLLFAGSFSWVLTAIGSLKIHNVVDPESVSKEQELGAIEEEEGDLTLGSDETVTTVIDDNQIV